MQTSRLTFASSIFYKAHRRRRVSEMTRSESRARSIHRSATTMGHHHSNHQPNSLSQSYKYASDQRTCFLGHLTQRLGLLLALDLQSSQLLHLLTEAQNTTTSSDPAQSPITLQLQYTKNSRFGLVEPRQVVDERVGLLHHLQDVVRQRRNLPNVGPAHHRISHLSATISLLIRSFRAAPRPWSPASWCRLQWRPAAAAAR